LFAVGKKLYLFGGGMLLLLSLLPPLLRTDYSHFVD
jgi:hypothetical protein